MRAPLPQPPDGGQERPGLGGADDDPPVNARRDGGGGPLDPVDRVRAEAAEFDGVAEGVVEHRLPAPLGRPGRRLAGQGRGAGGQRQPHRGGVFQVGDRERGPLGPVEGGGDSREAARREFGEETGLDGRLLGTPAAVTVRAYREDWTPTLGLSYAAVLDGSLHPGRRKPPACRVDPAVI